ncbi:MAG: MaoC family dehydratase [Burkholderiales bacterium]|nr:MaoC family dehydratase [Burkholderiales bacterium]
MNTSHLLHWEDFTAGQRVPLGTVKVDRDEVLAFAKAYDPQPFHVDEAAAKSSLFGQLVASGWHTCSMVMRLMCDGLLLRAASLGSPGVEALRWLKPVAPGDVLRAEWLVLDTRRSRSRPDVGLVSARWEVFNQHDELVLTLESTGMFRTRSTQTS